MENLNVPFYDILDYIANSIESNIRELEGLIRLVAYATVTGRPLDMELATEALKDILPPPRPRKITIEMIQKEVCSYYNIEMSELLSKNVTSSWWCLARWPCSVRQFTDASYPQIGDQFGGRDHTTVIHAAEKVKKLDSDPELAATIDELSKRLDPNHS